MAEPSPAAGRDGRDGRDAIPADSVALAERLGAAVYALEVVGTRALTPTMHRLVLHAPTLAELDHRPGQDLMFAVPHDGATVRRRYTIRSSDRDAATVDVDVVLHGDGPGARWAASARPGDRIEAIGPRGKVVTDDDAPWNLFVGDESFAPAALAMAEGVGGDVPTFTLLAVDTAADEPPAAVSSEAILCFVHRTGTTGTDAERLLTRLDGIELPGGPGRVYLGGERTLVATLRDALVARGIAGDRIAAKAYWRADAPNQSHGEPARE